MKISPMPSAPMPTMDLQGNPTQSRVDSVRSLRMTTNANPLMNEQPIQDVNTPTQAAVEVTQPLSPQLALLAKQKRALQVKERELVNRERALSQPTSGSGIDIARLKSEPLSVLLENGVTYEQLTNAIMANSGNSEINSLKAEIESLKQGIDQKFTEKDAQAERQVLAEMQREANRLCGTGDDFELVRETRNVPNVMKLIERTYRKTGEVLDVREALQLYEAELYKDAQKMMRYKKLQSQYSPMTSQPQPQLRQTGMRTLTNRDTASVPMSSRARAMAAFYGTLKR